MAQLTYPVGITEVQLTSNWCPTVFHNWCPTVCHLAYLGRQLDRSFGLVFIAHGTQLDTSWTSVGRQLDVSWTSVGPQFWISWTLGTQLDSSWTPVGHQLDSSWTSVGPQFWLLRVPPGSAVPGFWLYRILGYRVPYCCTGLLWYRVP
jgi:Flp pilus assembly pilin Flp